MKNDGSFHSYRSELFSGKPILRFGAALFLFIFVVLTFLAALLVLLPA